MSKFNYLVPLLGINLLISACQSPGEIIQSKENMLAAAGFSVKPADTPQRLAALNALPPNKIVQQAKGNRVVYVYGDPAVCKCVYFGGQQAYGNYRAMVFQQKIADEQQLTATMQQDAAFDFSPWGPGFGYY